MNPSAPRCPVFIVGAPRSGTTLLQYILRSHPALSLPTGESHFVVPLYRTAAQYGDLTQVENVQRVLHAMETQSAEFLHTDLHGLKFNVTTLTQEFIAEGRSTVRDIITGLFEKNAAGEGKPRWGDKTPYYGLHIPKLLAWWPDAQIIHLVRDGRDVALSMFARRHDFGAYNIYMVAKQWEQYVECAREHGRQAPASQYLELRYEDLLDDQKSALRTICSFLGEAYSDALLDFKKSGEAGKTPLLQRPIQKSNQDKWKQDLTAWQIHVFESAAGETLKKFNYPLLAPNRRLPLPLRALFRVHHMLASRWFRAFGPKKLLWTPPSPS